MWTIHHYMVAFPQLCLKGFNSNIFLVCSFDILTSNSLEFTVLIECQLKYHLLLFNTVVTITTKDYL